MTRLHRRSHRHAFHELPLVFFTALSTAGAGTGWAFLLRALLGSGSWTVPREGALVSAGLLLAGAVASFGHLGVPLRGFLALRRVGRSPLSDEVLLLILALTGSVARGVLPVAGTVATALSIFTGMISFLLLVALGRVYRLPGQEGWRGPGLVQPLVLGTLFGGLALGAPGGQEVGGWGFPPAVVALLLLVDGGFLLYRGRILAFGRRRALPLHPGTFRLRWPLLLGRALLVPVVPLMLLLLSSEGALPALLFLVGGIFVDRWAFYGLAQQRSTEAEVARVEGVLSRTMHEPGNTSGAR